MSFAEVAELKRQLSAERAENARLKAAVDTARQRMHARTDALMAVGRLAIRSLPETTDHEEILRRLSWDDPKTAIRWVEELAALVAPAAPGSHADDKATQEAI